MNAGDLQITDDSVLSEEGAQYMIGMSPRYGAWGRSTGALAGNSSQVLGAGYFSGARGRAVVDGPSIVRAVPLQSLRNEPFADFFWKSLTSDAGGLPFGEK